MNDKLPHHQDVVARERGEGGGKGEPRREVQRAIHEGMFSLDPLNGGTSLPLNRKKDLKKTIMKVFEWNVFMRPPSFQANLFVPRSGALGSFLARHSLPLSSFEPADGPKKAPQRTTRVHPHVKSTISLL